MSVLDKLLYLKKVRTELGLINEDENDNYTSYVGFFFDRQEDEVPADLRMRYRRLKERILRLEEKYKEQYGENWKNVLVKRVFQMRSR